MLEDIARMVVISWSPNLMSAQAFLTCTVGYIVWFAGVLVRRWWVFLLQVTAGMFLINLGLDIMRLLGRMDTLRAMAAQ